MSEPKPHWRSLDDLADTPAFRARAAKEFPGYLNVREGAGEADVEGDGFDRRRFLQLMAASAALAGVGQSGCRRPNLEILPYTQPPEDVVPGLPNYFATSIPRPGGAFPVLVESHEGRPTKIEGHPRHPASRVEADWFGDGRAWGHGAADVFAQAAILDLYHPDRSGQVLRGGQGSSWQAFDEFAEAHFGKLREAQGKGLRFLSEEVSSPALRLLRKHIRETLPEAGWHTYEPIDDANILRGAELAFGEPLRPAYGFDEADVILALDADFLGVEGSVRDVAAFTKRRRIRHDGKAPDLSRLYVVENTYTVTGLNADHRLRLPAAHILDYVLQLARNVLAALPQARPLGDLTPLKAALDEAPTDLERGPLIDLWVKEVADDLRRQRGRGLVLAGRRQPPLVHALVHLLNEALDNKQAVRFRKPSPDAGKSLQDLTDAAAKGEVDTLVVLGGNPVYDAPADLKFADVLGQAKTTVRLGLHADETSARCQWHLPATHFLEAWGDAESADGTYSVVQPLIEPLLGGRSVLEVVARLTKYKKTDPYPILVRSFAERTGSAKEDLIEKQEAGQFEGDADREEARRFQAAFRAFVQKGWQEKSAGEPTPVKFSPAKMLAELVARKPAARIGPDNLELSFHADYRLFDGRHAGNAWLQELPGPIAKLTWDNAAFLSPATAEKVGVRSKDVIRLTLAGQSVDMPVYVLPGQADDSISVHLGYGRTRAGRVGSITTQTAQGALRPDEKDGGGFDVYPLRTAAAANFADGLRVEKTGKTYRLAGTQEHFALEGDRQHGRDIVRVETLRQFADRPHEKQDRVRDRESNGRYKPLDLSLPVKLDENQGWGMVIDLHACVGCNACVVACQSENNVPVVGKDEVYRGREMHWIRIDRYFSGPKEDPSIAIQPVACVHCEQAPCELVCPVNAAVHSPEGLNLQVYNRCVGTRYCSNNCPYKARRFNWFDYNQRPLDQLRLGPLAEKGTAEMLKMQKNPDVTVRSRGVMEKCTYCIQRIERAKIGTKLKVSARDAAAGRREAPKPDEPQGAPGDYRVPDGVITPACAQACPASAIVFGNVKDPHSRVARLKAGNTREYLLLEELNTKPRTSYLSRVTNPNEKMPAPPGEGAT